MNFTQLQNSYPTKEHAEMDAEILNNKGIKTEITKSQMDIDADVIASTDLTRIFLAVEAGREEEAKAILIEAEEEMNSSFEEEYFLKSYTDEELIDVIKKADEWSDFDYEFALDILKERGIEFTDDEKADFYEDRIIHLAEPIRIKTYIIVIGYVLIMGLLGALIGLFIWIGKEKLPNGQKVYRYDEFSRMHGGIIAVLSIIFFLLVLISNYAELYHYSS